MLFVLGIYGALVYLLIFKFKLVRPVSTFIWRWVAVLIMQIVNSELLHDPPLAVADL